MVALFAYNKSIAFQRSDTVIVCFSAFLGRDGHASQLWFLPLGAPVLSGAWAPGPGARGPGPWARARGLGAGVGPRLLAGALPLFSRKLGDMMLVHPVFGIKLCTAL